MTNKEAISIITQIKGIITNDNSWSDAAKVAVKEAFDLAIKALEKRTQGEWKDHSEEGYVECPFCEHLTNCEDNIDELHFCWNCGAKMQKSGKENDSEE